MYVCAHSRLDDSVSAPICCSTAGKVSELIYFPDSCLLQHLAVPDRNASERLACLHVPGGRIPL